jgi:hypothetical protein
MNMKRTFLLVLTTSLLFWTYWSCKDAITGGRSNVVFPDSGVSYGRQVEPLFLQSCAYSGCHGADTFEANGFSLDSYANATYKPGIIIPCRRNQACNPENSILVQSIEGINGLQRMPTQGTPLNQNQINGIKTWIREGAQNN